MTEYKKSSVAERTSIAPHTWIMQGRYVNRVAIELRRTRTEGQYPLPPIFYYVTRYWPATGIESIEWFRDKVKAKAYYTRLVKDAVYGELKEPALCQ